MPQKVNQCWHTLIESHKKPIHSFLSSLSHSCIHITNGLTLKFGSFSSSTLFSSRLIASFWYSYMGMGFWSALKLLHPCSIKMANWRTSSASSLLSLLRLQVNKHIFSLLVWINCVGFSCISLMLPVLAVASEVCSEICITTWECTTNKICNQYYLLLNFFIYIYLFSWIERSYKENIK